VATDSPSRVWLTLPTYNEAPNLERFVRAVHTELRTEIPDEFRIVVVDDSSPDGTGEIADRLAEELPEVEVLHRAGKEGLGPAYMAGFRYAYDRGASLIMVMDSDFSHDPRYLPAILRAAETADLVLGSRYVPGGGVQNWPRLRRVLSRGGGFYARLVLGTSVRDMTGGFRCIRREVLEAIDPGSLRSQGYVFNIEFTYRAIRGGWRVQEVPIVFKDRELGASKMSLPIALEALWIVPRIRGIRRGPRQVPARAQAASSDPPPETA
jgi:dolichol-phosphate mannosyltransferase